MAFFKPRFNLWCRVFTNGDGPTRTLRGYSKCQVRGPTSHDDFVSTNAVFQILFPAGSDVRGTSNGAADDFDWVNVAGWGSRWAVILSVADKGAGFPNEYRLAQCTWVQYGGGSITTQTQVGVVNPVLEPPEGYPPLPLVTVSTVWTALPPP